MSEPVVTFTLGGRRAGLRATHVHSVVELESVTPVPRAPAHIRGLTALRSAALAVIDCAVVIGLPSIEGELRGRRAAVIEEGGHLYALLVDEVEDVCSSLGELAPVPGDVGHAWARLALGLLETDHGPALLLSVDALVAGPSALAA
jgi:purine-binding chemotaxis protein CheW